MIKGKQFWFVAVARQCVNHLSEEMRLKWPASTLNGVHNLWSDMFWSSRQYHFSRSFHIHHRSNRPVSGLPIDGTSEISSMHSQMDEYLLRQISKMTDACHAAINSDYARDAYACVSSLTGSTLNAISEKAYSCQFWNWICRRKICIHVIRPIATGGIAQSDCISIRRHWINMQIGCDSWMRRVSATTKTVWMTK